MAKTKTRTQPGRMLTRLVFGVLLVSAAVNISAPSGDSQTRLIGLGGMVGACAVAYLLGRTYRA